MAASKADWEAVMREYVEGGDDVTHRALAEKHGVSPKTVERHAYSGRWQDARLLHRGEIAGLAAQKTREVVSDELAGMNTNLASKFYQLADESLDHALATSSGKERRAHTITAATATDKWRLLTGQTTDKTETYKAPQYTPEELAEHVAEVRKILATLPDEAVEQLGR